MPTTAAPTRLTQPASVAQEQVARVSRCAELFQDYCIVTESVRHGIDVHVNVAHNLSEDQEKP